jgi:hypothetical protein
MRKRIMTNPRMMSPSEAAAWGATTADKIGPTMVTNSSSSLRDTAPKIAPEVLPIPPTMSMPRNHTESMKGNWVGLAKAK